MPIFYSTNNQPILILSAAAGAGHLKAAEALVSAFKLKNISAEHIEVLKYTNPVFRKIYSDLYIKLVNKQPHFLGWLYETFDKPWEFQKRRLALDRLNTGPLVKFLKKAGPSLAVCTHFLPAEILLYLRKKEILNIPIGVVITDWDSHAMWLFKDVDWYFVACEETKVYLKEMGIPEEKIFVTGIPVDPVFSAQKSREDTRLKLGLGENKTTLLLSAGGFGVGSVEQLVQAVDKVSHDVQLVVICGKNTALKESQEKLIGLRHPIKVIGFTNEMDNWMAASDLLVGKSGGLTSSEAFCRGLIMVVVNPIPGQEERNSDHFLEEGVAIRCNNIPTIAYKIDTLLSDQPRLLKMQEAVKRFAKPNAAKEIVEIVIKDSRLSKT